MKTSVILLSMLAASAFAGTMKDTKGNTYSTTIIGNQEWMTRNMEAPIGNNHPSYYGLLYDWKTAKKVCPAGWRLPSKDDFEALIEYIKPVSGLAPQNAKRAWGEKFAIDLWGLSIYPAGGYYKGRTDKVGEKAFFWTSTPSDNSESYHAEVKYTIKTRTAYSDAYFSVRCMRNTKEVPQKADLTIGTVSDKQGNTYPIVKIGNQTWTAKNMEMTTDNSYCSSTKCKEYGQMYTIEDALTICPDGWRLPSAEDFEKLINTVGESHERSKDFASFLLQAPNAWNTKTSPFAPDAYGFSAVPSGAYILYENKFNHKGEGKFAAFWTTSFERDNPVAAVFSEDYSKIDDVENGSKLSVRCIQATKEELAEIQRKLQAKIAQQEREEKARIKKEQEAEKARIQKEREEQKAREEKQALEEKKRLEAEAAERKRLEKEELARQQLEQQEKRRQEIENARNIVPQKGRDVKTNDGKIYPTVKIGNQIWMSKNMDRDVEKSRCLDKKEDNCLKYGRLYNWETANTVCPAGWRLPTAEEVEILLDVASFTPSEERKHRSRTLRELQQSLKDRINAYGFNEGEIDRSNPFFWTSTEIDGGQCTTYNFNGEGPQPAGKRLLRYTRCIRDLPKK